MLIKKEKEKQTCKIKGKKIFQLKEKKILLF